MLSYSNLAQIKQVCQMCPKRLSLEDEFLLSFTHRTTVKLYSMVTPCECITTVGISENALSYPWLLLEAVSAASVIRLLLMLGLLELLPQPLYPVVVARRQSVAMGEERMKELKTIVHPHLCMP